MATTNERTHPRSPPIRIRGFGFHFPGSPVAISSLPLTADEAKRLRRLGQETTHISTEDSTALMLHAASEALRQSGMSASDLQMVISAPSLMTSYGLEIPAVAIRAGLGSTHAQCLNIAQGCVGVLRGIDLAAQLLAARPRGGDIMVVTSCRASSHTRNMNHGAFFWGDAAAAVILTAASGPGLEIVSYAEASNTENWGAMRIAQGDAVDGISGPGQDEAHLIQVTFETPESQIDYIRGEQQNFAAVVNQLLSSQRLEQSDIEALFLPSTGKNRVPVLLSDHHDLATRIKTDFRYAHFGGVDPVLCLHQHLNRGPAEGSWQIVASPAFAAQWGGLLLRVLA